MKRGQLILAVFLIVSMGLGSLASSVSPVKAQTLPTPVKTAACSIPEGERIHLVGKAGEAIPLHVEAVSATASDCVWTAGKPAQFGSLELRETVNVLEGTYTPDPAHIGSDEFELLVSNSHGLPSRVTVLVDLMPPTLTPLSDPAVFPERVTEVRPAEAGTASLSNLTVITPTMQVSLTNKYVFANDWNANSEITLTVGLSSWTKFANSYGWIWFYVDVLLQPGMTVEMTDGVTTISHQVIDLKVLSINTDTDVVSGTGKPGKLYPAACIPTAGGSSNCYGLQPSDVDTLMNWSANFAGLVDIKLRSHGWVTQYDDYGNSTEVDWRVPSPWIEANVNQNSIEGRDLPAFSSVYLYVDGAYLKRRTSYNDGSVYFYLNDFDVKAGQTITLTSGTVSLSYKVQTITVDAQDIDTDILSGKGDPNKLVRVYACSSSSSCTDYKETSTDAQGNWSYDFRPFIDIDKTSYGWAYQEDANTNITWYRWFVPNPVLTAYPLYDQVSADRFKPGGEVTLTIGSLTWKKIADETGWLYINTTGHDLVAGDVVVMTQGALSINHTVIDLQVTGIDVDADTVSGKAPANSQSTVWSYANGYYETTVTANSTGDWMAYFSGQLDLKPGTWGNVEQSDPEGDSTAINWHVPDPRIVADPQYDQIFVVDWPANTEVKVTIGTQTWDLTMGSDGWVELRLEGFDLKAGQHIVVSGAGITKEHTVFDLSITEIDDKNDIVRGHAGANASVSVFAINPSYYGSSVDTNTDANGNWTADFSNYEDLRPGYTFYVEQADSDRDVTLFTLDYGSVIFLPLIQR